MEFIDQVENLRIVEGSEGQIYLRWENAEDGRDREEMFQRKTEGIFVHYVNVHTKVRINIASNNPMFEILEKMFEIAQNKTVKMNDSKKMTNADVVKKLIGQINPVGDSSIDEERFENLKEMCELVNLLVVEIDDMAYMNRNSQEFSVKRSADYGSKFLSRLVQIIK